VFFLGPDFDPVDFDRVDADVPQSKGDAPRTPSADVPDRPPQRESAARDAVFLQPGPVREEPVSFSTAWLGLGGGFLFLAGQAARPDERTRRRNAP
jgi:hypothetical protein